MAIAFSRRDKEPSLLTRLLGSRRSTGGYSDEAFLTFEPWGPQGDHSVISTSCENETDFRRTLIDPETTSESESQHAGSSLQNKESSDKGAGTALGLMSRDGPAVQKLESLSTAGAAACHDDPEVCPFEWEYLH